MLLYIAEALTRYTLILVNVFDREYKLPPQEVDSSLGMSFTYAVQG